MHGETSGSPYMVKAQMASMKAVCLRFRAHHTPLTSDTVHLQVIFMHKQHHSLTPQQTSGALNMSLTSHIFIQPHQCKDNGTSVAAAITDVFRKNGITVSNKFVRILKIFTNIYDIKRAPTLYLPLRH